MANDWIPVSVSLPNKRKVLAIARSTKRSKHEVAGLLSHFWGWASGESADGFLSGVTFTDLVESVGGDEELWQAVADVDWLLVEDGGLRVPESDEWITRGAKARLMATKRQVECRDRKRAPQQKESVTKLSRLKRDKSVTTEQNRTEENSNTSEAAPRERDEMWDSVVANFPIKPNTKSDCTRIGKLVRDLKLKHAIPSEIPARIGAYQARYKNIPVTPEGVLKHWDSLATGSVPNSAPTAAQVAQLDRDRKFEESGLLLDMNKSDTQMEVA